MIFDMTKRSGGGGELLYNRYGIAYAKDMTIPVVNPDAFPNYWYCYDLETQRT